MSCLTTNPAVSEYLSRLNTGNTELINGQNEVDTVADQPNETNSPTSDKPQMEKMSTVKLTNDPQSPTIGSISCDVSNDFNRPTTPPASTPSPIQVKNVNRRKIRNQYLAGNMTLNNTDDLDELELEEDLEEEGLVDEEEEPLDLEPETKDESLNEADNEVAALHGSNELDTNQLNQDCIRELNEVAKLSNKDITKEIIELNNRMDTELSKDLIVCGKCNSDFRLSDILLFIEHKVNGCMGLTRDENNNSLSKFIS